MPNVVLELENICKSFFGVTALQDVTLTLGEGQILGLVGENGAGKSTLVNILGGIIRADKGMVRFDNKRYAPPGPADAMLAGIALIHQELNLFTNLSILDNLFINGFPRLSRTPFINKRKAREQAQKLLRAVGLDVPAYTLVEKLSPGERQLLEIAKALGAKAKIIIFDEPTTSLTSKESQRLFSMIEQLRSQRKTIIYISHNLPDVLNLADQIVVLRDGRLVGAGPRNDFTIDRMISLMVGRDISQMYPVRRSEPGSEAVLGAEQVSQTGIVSDISFELYAGEVLGFFGLMGSGRTELARILFGLDSFERGRIVINGKAGQRFSPIRNIAQKMAFITENRREEGLLMEANVFDNLALVSLPRYTKLNIPRIIDRTRISRSIRALIGALKIKTGPADKQLAHNLSGGNQQKVVIGKWLMTEPLILIMDEPTRGIDIGAKYEVYLIMNDLAQKGAGVLFISSELEELMGMCDRILVMSHGQIQGCFEKGDFDEEKILHAAFGQPQHMQSR